MATCAVALGGTGRARALRAELRATLRLAAPLAAMQVGQLAITTTDVLLLGRLGPQPLAAASLALAPFHALFLFGLGMVMGTATLFAQARGAGQSLRIRKTVQQSWLLVAVVTLPVWLLLTQIRAFYALIGPDPALVDDAVRFTHLLMLALPGMLVVVLLRNLMAALGAGRPTLLITLGGILLNAGLGYGLIFGGFGLPRLELVGSALATVITNTAMGVCAVAWGLVDRRFRRYVAPRGWRPDWRLFGALARFGAPVGGALILEAGLFSASGLLMSKLGAVSLAAHQVTLQICSLLFMLPLGIGLAATTRVGLLTGAGDRAGARRAGRVAGGLGAACMAAVALLFLLGAEPMVGLFMRDDDALGLETAVLAITLLHLAAVFQLADGLQVIGASALRGLGDTRAPMWIAAFGYWGIGFPASLTLGLHTALGGLGVWLGLALSLSVVAVLLLGRFEQLSRRRPGPAR